MYCYGVLENSKKFHASIVTRVTGDCPFVDPKLVDKAIELFKKNELIMFQTH